MRAAPYKKRGVAGTEAAREIANVVDDSGGHKLWVFKPPVTEQGPVNRHPWEGVLSGVTVGEFAAGAGCFMATAIGAGMRGEWLAESDDTTRALAMANCPSVKQELCSIYDRDPSDLPWVHVLLGGACFASPLVGPENSRHGKMTGQTPQFASCTTWQ